MFAGQNKKYTGTRFQLEGLLGLVVGGLDYKKYLVWFFSVSLESRSM